MTKPIVSLQMHTLYTIRYWQFTHYAGYPIVRSYHMYHTSHSMLSTYFVIVITLQLIYINVLMCQEVQHNKLILILLDGFRWDYFQPNHVGFHQMFQEGVKAEYLQPVFPSVSYTNYYSIATGE